MDVLPGPSTQKTLEQNFEILIARSLVNYLPAFKPLKGNVNQHITHQFTKELSQKSQVVRKLQGWFREYIDIENN